ncbi:hypothetical protein ACC691_41030, partial [Rhizobium johnstonii]|uniref:hypothetical protein n=1 Tax=Rhizobium johnstonii TaxID=3019933 RepID=UPI003F9B7692
VERTKGDVDGQALTKALLSKPIAPDTLTQFPGGFAYSDKYRFPTIADGDMALVPCASTISDGLWVTASGIPMVNPQTAD